MKITQPYITFNLIRNQDNDYPDAEGQLIYSSSFEYHVLTVNYKCVGKWHYNGHDCDLKNIELDWIDNKGDKFTQVIDLGRRNSAYSKHKHHLERKANKNDMLVCPECKKPAKRLILALTGNGLFLCRKCG